MKHNFTENKKKKKKPKRSGRGYSFVTRPMCFLCFSIYLSYEKMRMLNSSKKKAIAVSRMILE